MRSFATSRHLVAAAVLAGTLAVAGDGAGAQPGQPVPTTPPWTVPPWTMPPIDLPPVPTTPTTAPGATTPTTAPGTPTAPPTTAAPTTPPTTAPGTAPSPGVPMPQPTPETDGPSAWIVTLEEGAGDVAAAAADQLGDLGLDADPSQVFTDALLGYTATLTADQATQLADLPGVASVERNGLAWISETQPNAPWGVDRVDQADLPLSGSYTYTATGAGVTAYVIDSGARLSHGEFGGRAVTGVDVVDGGPADDCLGHGTHVSSSIGGQVHGVAKQVELVQVRVFGCESTAPIADIIEGIDWAVADHQPGEPAVANLSLGYLGSEALDQAIDRLIADGVTVVVAAGNGVPLIGVPLDACGWSPARVPGAVTVAASDKNDNMASFTNRGRCVDIIAPGVEVPGAGHSGDTATATMSGTSMASPHVAGAAAKILQGNPGAAPAAVADALKQQATPDTIAGTGTYCYLFIICVVPATPNLLVRSNL